MAPFGFVIIVVSALTLAVLALRQYVREPNAAKLLVQLLGLSLYLAAIFYFLGLPGGVVPKGPDDDRKFLAAVLALYVAIVCGMIAQFVYSWFDKPRRNRRGKPDWAGAVKPLCVSPIVL